jgi:hypothetical protein
MKFAPSPLFVLAAPLLEEKNDVIARAGKTDILHPTLFHRPRRWTAFPTNNCPMYSCRIRLTDIAQ